MWFKPAAFTADTSSNVDTSFQYFIAIWGSVTVVDAICLLLDVFESLQIQYLFD